jgi:hypothetical protein
MQSAYLETLRNKPAYTAAVRFIDKLVASGVPLDNIQASNFENRKGMTQGVIQKGANAGQPNGKYGNRFVIIMPKGQENNSMTWKKYNDFRDRHVVEAIELGTVGLPQRGADGQQGVSAPAKAKELVTMAA